MQVFDSEEGKLRHVLAFSFLLVTDRSEHDTDYLLLISQWDEITMPSLPNNKEIQVDVAASRTR